MHLVGRLAAPPEKLTSLSGVEVIKYSIATSHGPADDRRTCWWRVVHYPKDGAPNRQKDYMLSLGKGCVFHFLPLFFFLQHSFGSLVHFIS